MEKDQNNLLKFKKGICNLWETRYYWYWRLMVFIYEYQEGEIFIRNTE